MLFALHLRQVAVVTLIVTNFKLDFNCYANFWKSYLKTCSVIVLFFNVFDHENMWTYSIFPFNKIVKSFLRLCLFQQIYLRISFDSIIFILLVFLDFIVSQSIWKQVSNFSTVVRNSKSICLSLLFYCFLPKQ